MPRKKSDKVTFRDIAEASDVSLITVSRYFNQPDLVSPSTRKNIEHAINELGYTQDALAHILATGKSNLIGVLLPHLHTGFYTELLSKLIEYGKQKDCVFIPYTSKSAKEEIRTIQKLSTYRIKGLIVLSFWLSVEQLEALEMPVITIERSAGNFMHINNDNFEGGRIAAEKLIENQCEAFVHINNGYDASLPSFKRIIGFEYAIADRPYLRIVERALTDPHSSKAPEAMAEVFQTIIEKYPHQKLGVFCSNDDIAQMFQRQCIIHGLAMPRDIELIGYDNSYVSQNAIYPITSIDQNITTMAKIAVDAFDNCIPHESIVPCRLVEKETTTNLTHVK